MNKIFFGAVGAVALSMSAPASAADLAARLYPRAPIAAIYDWSGFYIGANGGGGSARNCWDFLTPAGAFVAADGCHNSTGGTFGGQIGYRWQAANWVFGLEGQGNWADFSGSNVSPAGVLTPFGGLTDRTRVDAFGLFTGQVGYAWNNVLGYVKGGGAVVRDKYDILTSAGVLFASGGETRWGATVGGGLEVGFAPNWTVGVEYDHIFLGNRNSTIASPVGGVVGLERIRQDIDMGLVRLNYRFGQVVAR